MKVTMNFNPEYGRKVLVLASGSPEQAKIVSNYTDEEVFQECFKHGCVPYCFSGPKIVEEEYSKTTECRIKWIDDGTEEDVLIYEYDCEPEDEGTEFDNNIFFYGMSRSECYKAMVNKEVCEGEWRIIEIY